MSKATLDIEYWIVCQEHGDDLEVFDIHQHPDGLVVFTVHSCQRCLSDEHDQSYQAGYKQAERDNDL